MRKEPKKISLILLAILLISLSISGDVYIYSTSKPIHISSDQLLRK